MNRSYLILIFIEKNAQFYKFLYRLGSSQKNRGKIKKMKKKTGFLYIIFMLNSILFANDTELGCQNDFLNQTECKEPINILQNNNALEEELLRIKKEKENRQKRIENENKLLNINIADYIKPKNKEESQSDIPILLNINGINVYSYKNALLKSKESKKPIFTLIYKENCPFCKKFFEDLKTDKRLNKIIKSNYEMTMISIKDIYAYNQFQTDISPTIFIINEKGENIANPIKGYIQDKEKLIEYLNNIINFLKKAKK